MNSYNILVIIIGISALFAYINHRLIKMPFVIGLFFLSSILSLLILSSKFWANSYFTEIKSLVQSIDISKYILEYMLGYLLFAGSLHTEWIDIKKQIKQLLLR
jgi:CPA1 family monovalent cation:H+ antiporter